MEDIEKRRLSSELFSHGLKTQTPENSGAHQNRQNTRIQELEIRLQELAKANQFKMDRMAKSLKRIEETQEQQRQEFAHQYAELSSKTNERRLAEAKVNEMMERQELMIKNFETRMSQMRKLVEQKELQLMKFKSELTAVTQELSRLKLKSSRTIGS